MMTSLVNTAEIDSKIAFAARKVEEALNDEERTAAKNLLTELKYERNALRFPIVTEVRNGEIKIVHPARLTRPGNDIDEVAMFVRRALAFQAMLTVKTSI